MARIPKADSSTISTSSIEQPSKLESQEAQHIQTKKGIEQHIETSGYSAASDNPIGETSKSGGQTLKPPEISKDARKVVEAFGRFLQSTSLDEAELSDATKLFLFKVASRPKNMVDRAAKAVNEALDLAGQQPLTAQAMQFMERVMAASDDRIQKAAQVVMRSFKN